MPRLLNCLLLLLMFLLFVSAESMANPGQFGDSGLLSQPVAQTLNEGNICVGLWANCSDGVDTGTGNTGGSLIIPTTITMGLGTFIESYGSYPNLLFNGDEDTSGRGYANAGFKLRVFGKRSDAFRIAVDTQARRLVSDNTDFDGLTDYVGRVIASYNLDQIGIHANAGYASNDSPSTLKYDDQMLFGGGLEYFPVTRLRLLAEFSYETGKLAGMEGPTEATIGFQYFITPHLTLNLGGAMGLSDGSPNWRAIFGLTTCQGVGTFNRPVPRLVDPDVVDEPLEPVKVSKIRLLTPLLSKAPMTPSPISHLEIPLKDPNQQVFVDPASRLKSPELSALEISPVSSVGTLRPVSDSALPQEPFVAKVKRRFRLPDFTFEYNQWDLSEEGRKALSLVAEELRQRGEYFILSIEGHTDNVGSEAYNQDLSFKRAVAAATHLVLRDGLDPARIFVKGFGESTPIADNASDEGRAKNRRIELLLLVPEGFEEVELEVIPKEIPQGQTLPLRGADNATVVDSPTIDPLSIEEAIMEKTGSVTAKPAGAFSQIDTVEGQKTPQ